MSLSAPYNKNRGARRTRGRSGRMSIRSYCYVFDGLRPYDVVVMREIIGHERLNVKAAVLKEGNGACRMELVAADVSTLRYIVTLANKRAKREFPYVEVE